MIPLNDNQRQQLRDLSDMREGNTYLSTNPRLEAYTIALRDQYPEYFHRTQADLKERVFVDTPATIPPSLYKRTVLTLANSSRKVLG